MRVIGSRKELAVARLALLFGVFITGTSTALAERLPVKIYTTADGLGHNVIHRVVRDSRGFLWFCTREGLSRFDGYSFTNYGLEHGLPSAIVNDLLETPDGQYWVATSAGLCRFNPLGKPQAWAGGAIFTVYYPAQDKRSKYISTILWDRAGAIWCGTDNGLYRAEVYDREVNFEPVDLKIPDYLESRSIRCLFEDRAGSLWVGAASGLFRRLPDGRVEAYTIRDGLPDNGIQSLLEDREGRFWVGTGAGGLCRLVSDPAPARNIVARAYSDKDGLPTRWINQLFQASDGSMWAGSNAGLIQFLPTADGRDVRFRTYGEAHGLSFQQEVASLVEDRNGNLWVGMLHGGAAKIVRNGFTTFGRADGFLLATSVFETRAGDLLVAGVLAGNKAMIYRFDGEKFIPIAPQISKAAGGFSWGWNQTVLEDHTGEWWMATKGVSRFPKVSQPEQLAHTPALARYTTRDGLAADSILRLFEDSRGDVWICSVGEGKGPNGLSRWERSTSAFHHYTEKDILPRLDKFYVSSFAEDRAGALWIGFSGDGGLVRYRDGRFTLFTTSDGVPPGQIRNLFVDSAGRLWVPTYRGGLSRIDDTTAERPQLVTYTTADGLSSNEVTAVTEDHWGRIYIGTGRGLDRLDPATGRVRHYTTADGLPLGEMATGFRDRQGALWFSFSSGLVRLVPELDPPLVSPPVLITGLHIAGDAQPISALGETEVAPIELAADRNQLQIDFVGLGFSPGEGLRYQYRLEGASEDWSPLAEQRTVNFANLAPGRYRFLARAVNADGIASDVPASFSFTILPPVWQRWWFVALAVAMTVLAVYSLYRYRLAQKLKVERVRTRIATDLHDDIGANLSLIAMASEVAHRQSREDHQQMQETLSLISGTSRELVDSMGDIVWAVNPHRDHLVDLVKRMRRFASDVFSACGITFRFDSPSDDRDIRLGTETRREVLLIFKEAVNNIARHSECTDVDIEFRPKGGWLVLKLNDNGKGFDSAKAIDGSGLQSMRQRADRLGGSLDVASRNGKGTTVTLKTPIR